jgi:membrane protein
LILGATGVFAQMQDALNTIWEVKPKPGGGVKAFLKKRLVGFGIVLLIGVLLLALIALSAVLSAIGSRFGNLNILYQVGNEAISFGVIAVLFAVIFKYLPDAKVEWRDVWMGAILTALLFSIGKYLIGLYMGRSSVGSVYGAAGSLVVLLIWIYYSAQIMFFGAEFTQVFARRRGTLVQPADNAVKLTADERVQAGMEPEKPPAHDPRDESPYAGALARPLRPVTAYPYRMKEATPSVQAQATLGLIALLAFNLFRLKRRRRAA